MTPAGSDSVKPTGRQLAYLKALAARAGQSFTWPRTRSQASREIRRLQAAEPTAAIPRDLDLEAEQAAREANADVPVQSFEVAGFAATASWRQKS